MTRRRTTPARTAGKATALLIAASLVAATAPILPRGIETATFLSGSRDETAVASYRLKSHSPNDYDAAIREALAKDDADLADSLVALAIHEAVPLPAETVRAVDKAVAERGTRMAGEAWNGFVSGSAESEPALAGAIAADLSGYGDVRDLYTEAHNYAAGGAVDTTTVALAAVGITLTVATVFTLGATAPEKVGVSTIKIVNRLGRLSKPLRRQVLRLAGEAVDTGALRRLGRSLGTFDLTAVRTAARQIVRPAPAAKLKQLGADVATLGKNAGYRGTLDVLAKADDAAAISRMARLSRTFGKATRGALFMLGDVALTLAAIAGVVFSWTAGALFWIFAAVLILTRTAVLLIRLSFGTLRWVVRRLRDRARLAARVDGVLARA